MDSPVDRLGPDIAQGGDGDLGQGEALVEGGGQEPVGEGEHGAAAGTAAFNPAFDVTPAALVTVIVTERRVITPCADG